MSDHVMQGMQPMCDSCPDLETGIGVPCRYWVEGKPCIEDVEVANEG